MFSGKTFVVTGAARGIGAAICRALTDRGGTVVGLDVLAAEEQLPERSTLLRCDVTVAEEVFSALDQVPAIDGVVCVAAVVKPGPLETLNELDWASALAVNLTGAWLTMCAAHPALGASGGSIVVVSSVAGQVPFPGGGAYSASKAALVALMRQAAVEWGPAGIRVNAVSPGSTTTPMNAEVHTDESRAERIAVTPLRRIASAADVADPVCFLLSDYARHVTGQDLTIDGGFLLSTLPAPVNTHEETDEPATSR